MIAKAQRPKITRQPGRVTGQKVKDSKQKVVGRSLSGSTPHHPSQNPASKAKVRKQSSPTGKL